MDKFTGLYEKSKGGTETKYRELLTHLTNGELDDVQLICSRIREFDDTKKYKVYWAHDLATDPEAFKLRDSEIMSKLDLLVFVSNIQFEQYRAYHGVPHSKSIVIPNGIADQRQVIEKPKDVINLIYHTTPHRGLEILVPVFYELYKIFDKKIHLDIFSSFEIYGWGERDAPYKRVFEMANGHRGITNHGFQENSIVREHLKKAHIFAFPSIWEETSCVAAIEAMTDQCLIVHPQYGALRETIPFGMSITYPWTEDQQVHTNRFANHLAHAIENYDELNKNLTLVSSMIQFKHSWTGTSELWRHALKRMKEENG